MTFWTEYFSWNFQRSPEGFFSWQHLLAVTTAVLCTIGSALFFGRRNREKTYAEKIRTLKIAALLLDGFELLKLTVLVIITGSFATLRSYYPLFLCSIPLIILPVAAFSKGRLQQASLDFVLVFGMLGCVLGTFMAANIYSVFPVLHFEPMVSLITHNLSGFAALYIGISGLATMKKENTVLSLGILGAFMTVAEIVNVIHSGIGYQDNYMFLTRSDGTPFLIVERWFGAGSPGYTLAVALLMWGYLLGFIVVFRALSRSRGRSRPLSRA
ncbi:MAG TPA: YwaF family protein [Candidatus Izemoplasmatales bacterium]|nr:YwaF family protein [Bacillota bacterium]HRY77764.1 YwaF family protein [Candidatus Izemoplasmatales bacterium]